jgi:hypothetical protein
MFTDASSLVTRMLVSAASPITGVVKTGLTGVVISGVIVGIVFIFAGVDEVDADVHPAARSAMIRRRGRNRLIASANGTAEG